MRVSFQFYFVYLVHNMDIQCINLERRNTLLYFWYVNIRLMCEYTVSNVNSKEMQIVNNRIIEWGANTNIVGTKLW